MISSESIFLKHKQAGQWLLDSIMLGRSGENNGTKFWADHNPGQLVTLKYIASRNLIVQMALNDPKHY